MICGRKMTRDRVYPVRHFCSPRTESKNIPQDSVEILYKAFKEVHMAAHPTETKVPKIYPCLLPVRSLLFCLLFLAYACMTDRQPGEISNIWSVMAVGVNLVTIAGLVLLTRRENSSYRELIHYRPGRTGIGKTIAITAAFVVIGMAGMYLAGFICYGAFFPAVTLEVTAPVPAVLAVINMVLLPLTVPFAEDGLYLGCGVNGIKNKYAAIIVPAFFYAFQHCFIPTFFDVRYMLYRFLSFLPLTVILCLYYYKKRDPVPVMIGHAVLDAATASMILMTSVIPGFYEEMCGMALAH